MGNSITEGRVANHAAFFEDNGYVGRGIGGQTSSRFLSCFREDSHQACSGAGRDAGTNDIAEMQALIMKNNLEDSVMVELARANKIGDFDVCVACRCLWLNPSAKDVAKDNAAECQNPEDAQENRFDTVDYYSEMVEGDNKALNSSYTRDGYTPL